MTMLSGNYGRGIFHAFACPTKIYLAFNELPEYNFTSRNKLIWGMGDARKKFNISRNKLIAVLLSNCLSPL